MKTNSDYKETQKYIKQWGKLSDKDLKALLRLIQNSPLKNKSDYNKIDAIKTLLL
jgi:hypothetical protein